MNAFFLNKLSKLYFTGYNNYVAKKLQRNLPLWNIYYLLITKSQWQIKYKNMYTNALVVGWAEGNRSLRAQFVNLWKIQLVRSLPDYFLLLASEAIRHMLCAYKIVDEMIMWNRSACNTFKVTTCISEFHCHKHACSSTSDRLSGLLWRFYTRYLPPCLNHEYMRNHKSHSNIRFVIRS